MSGITYIDMEGRNTNLCNHHNASA